MGGLTRAELLRRGVGGGVAPGLLGGIPPRDLRVPDAAAAGARVHAFVTHVALDARGRPAGRCRTIQLF